MTDKDDLTNGCECVQCRRFRSAMDTSHQTLSSDVVTVLKQRDELAADVSTLEAEVERLRKENEKQERIAAEVKETLNSNLRTLNHAYEELELDLARLRKIEELAKGLERIYLNPDYLDKDWRKALNDLFFVLEAHP